MKSLVFTLLSLFGVVTLALADGSDFDASKYYKLRWNRDGQSIITEDASGNLYVAGESQSLKQYWQFVPTGKEGCYYVQNATSKNYIQSCNMTNSSASKVATGSTAVEYYICWNNTREAYRLTSTDCPDYEDTSSSPHGLNKDGASSNIIVWTASDSNTGSYWQIEETEYDYDADASLRHSSFARQAGIYFMPCGTLGSLKIAKVKVTGEAAMRELEYPMYLLSGDGFEKTTVNTTSWWTLFTNDHAELARGYQGEVQVTLASNPPSGYSLYAYFDWDADGVFEQSEAKTDISSKVVTVLFTVPADALLRETRMRIRLTENGKEKADEEVIGQIFDGIVKACDFQKPTLTVLVNDTTRGSATFAPDSSPYTYRVQATPCGDAKFVCWLSGNRALSAKAERTITITGPTTLVAVFSPNTTDERPITDNLKAVLPDDDESFLQPQYYDLQGRRHPNAPQREHLYIIKESASKSKVVASGVNAR